MALATLPAPPPFGISTWSFRAIAMALSRLRSSSTVTVTPSRFEAASAAA